MNRRQFGQTLAATAALPLVPLPAHTAPVAVKPIHLMWGEAIARAQNGTTPAHLAKALKVPLDVAQSVQRELIRKNVIRAGATRGATIAVRPTFPKGGYRKVGGQLLDQAKAALDAELDLTPPRPSPAPVSDQDQTDHCNHGSSEEPRPDCKR